MIIKIKRLKTIGKFYDFSGQANGLDWHKNTFVFAPNAYGKTTLVNVLRSLHENDPNLIFARKTLGKAADPEAVIVIDQDNYLFRGSRWERPFSAIQIFDAPFIQANILTHEIGHEHKKNIHKILIGEQGIKLAEEFALMKTQEKTKSQELAKLTKRFTQGEFGCSLANFLAIAPTEEASVGPRILKLELEIRSKESENVVKGLNLPRTIIAPSFDLENAKALTIKKLTSAHEEAEKRVLAHIDLNFRDKSQARQFIRQGLDMITVDCPLCGQDLRNAAELLKKYQEFFDEAFRAYQENIAQQISALMKWNIDNELTGLTSAHNENLASLVYWKPYISGNNLPDITVQVEEFRIILTELNSIVLSLMEKKQKDPNVDIGLEEFNELSTKIDALKNTVQTYNVAVTDFTKKAKKYVADLPDADIASIREKLANEQTIKSRITPEWQKWTTEYSETKQAVEILLTNKSAKQRELEEYSKNIFETYQNRINEILLALGTDFEVTGLSGKTDGRANESYSDFGFLILQQAVPLATRQDDTPSFKNTLSEGDKSTLAFAFFVAALEKTPDLSKQIVVFDDPLSSLDETRREATARLLLALSSNVNQLNVFTHKKDFLYMLCDKMPDNKVLQIRFDKKNGSRIETFDVLHDRKGDHAQMIEDMERYINEDFGPAPETMQGNIRKMIEVVLKTKYYRHLANDINGNKGLAKILETLFSSGRLDTALKTSLFDLCNVTNGPHHGGLIDAPSKKLTRDEIIPLINETLVLLDRI